MFQLHLLIITVLLPCFLFHHKKYFIIIWIFFHKFLYIKFILCRFGHVFIADTGTSVGEISGISNFINSVDYRPKRPFRIITGSEDNSIGLFEGPPFKFKNTLNVISLYFISYICSWMQKLVHSRVFKIFFIFYFKKIIKFLCTVYVYNIW